MSSTAVRASSLASTLTDASREDLLARRDKTESVVLPRLAGSRMLVPGILALSETDTDLAGKTVEVHCEDLASGSDSFADELMKELLFARGAEGLVFINPPEDFKNVLTELTSEFHWESRVTFADEGSVSL